MLVWAKSRLFTFSSFSILIISTSAFFANCCSNNSMLKNLENSFHTYSYLKNFSRSKISHYLSILKFSSVAESSKAVDNLPSNFSASAKASALSSFKSWYCSWEMNIDLILCSKFNIVDLLHLRLRLSSSDQTTTLMFNRSFVKASMSAANLAILGKKWFFNWSTCSSCAKLSNRLLISLTGVCSEYVSFICSMDASILFICW